MQEQEAPWPARRAPRKPCPGSRWKAGILPVVVLGFGFGLAINTGCATVPRAAASATAEQERVVLELRARNAGYVRQIEELENRVFILEDQLDSSRLATEQKAPAVLPSILPSILPSRLPSISSTGDGRSDSQDDGPDTVETTIVAEHAVDYTGDAAQGAAAPVARNLARSPRPMLRLSSTPAARERSARLVTNVAAPEPGADARVVSAGRATPDPLRLYRDALETLRAGRPDAALSEFRRFLDANPVHDYADNALYWIGECHYAARRYGAAARAFRNVVERYPRGNKVPDAMLKLGFTLQAMGDETGGRAVLESLARAFPKHDAARLAIERLAHPEGAPTGAGGPAAFGTILPVVPPSAATGPVAPPHMAGVRR